MDEKLKSFLEENKELIKENRWCELYDKASKEVPAGKLANFLYEGLGQEVMLDCFSEEGKIPTGAFGGCRSLESIDIPNSVTSIGKWAFFDCGSLTSIEFAEPSSVTSIDGYAFYRCSRLKSITIPDRVTSIGHRAFEYCKCHIIFECDKSALAKNALAGFEGTYEFK